MSNMTMGLDKVQSEVSPLAGPLQYLGMPKPVKIADQFISYLATV